MSTIAVRKFLQGHNYYVPAMQAGGDLGQALQGRFSIGAPIAANAVSILSATSIAVAVDTSTMLLTNNGTEAQMGRYGRTLQVVASGVAVTNVDVYGRDYLGQKIRETFVLNGAVPVIGKKAFRYVDRVVAGVTAATTINVGTGTGFGVPYVTTRINSEWADNVVAAAGVLTPPVFVDPQTAITGSPRGTIVPTTVPNGAKVIEMDCEFTNFVNAANNGGLHGIMHIGA